MRGKGTNNIQDAASFYKLIKDEYAYNDDPFCPDDQRVKAIKWVIENRLSEPDRIIIRMYADIGSERKLGKLLGVARSTLREHLVQIKDAIKEGMKEATRYV